QRLMAKRPEARYQTPQELLDDLQQPSLLHHETGAADIAGLALADSESPPPSAMDSEDSLPVVAQVAGRLRGKAQANQSRRAPQDEREEPEDSTPAVSEVDERLRGKSRGKQARLARKGQPDTASEASSKTDARSKQKQTTRLKPDTRELPPRS